MFLGPVFEREVAIAPRQGWLYANRSIYGGGLLLIMCTAWMVLAGAQVLRNVGDFARFGAIIFQVLAPLQLSLTIFYAAFAAASAVAHEKDRRTIILLLMTELTDTELVLGKLGGALLHVYSILLAGLPVFALCTLFGGVGFDQVGRVFLVTCTTALLAGAIGATLAFWLDKSVQALAGTALAIVLWIGLGEAIYAGGFGSWHESISPLRAILAAAAPTPVPTADGFLALAIHFFAPIWQYLALTLGGSALLTTVAILGLRLWNPSREEYRQPVIEEEPEELHPATAAQQAQSGHVDARLRHAAKEDSRQVWDNPVLWRETQTWAHGTKILGIRAAYWLLFVLAAVGLYLEVTSGAIFARGDGAAALIPVAARYLVPLMFVSLVILNALAVTSVTGERDGMAIDLLLATDVRPDEFVIGKLGGTLWVGADLILLPLALLVYLWTQGGISLASLIYVVLGFSLLCIFVGTVGLHCGTSYASGREAISFSLGTVFFLFLGVGACMLLMVSFSGSFQGQLFPFIAFNLGGFLGLFVVLGSRSQASAIWVASFCLPFATFYAVTSFLIGQSGPVLGAILFAYGFMTAALLVPAWSDFDVAMGRSKGAEE